MDIIYQIGCIVSLIVLILINEIKEWKNHPTQEDHARAFSNLYTNKAERNIRLKFKDERRYQQFKEWFRSIKRGL